MKKWTKPIIAMMMALPLMTAPLAAHAEQQVIVYAPNKTATKLVVEHKAPYSYHEDGLLTKFLMHELGYTRYLKSYAVSHSEKSVTLNFKSTLANSQVVQGSTGGQFFTDRIAVTFFKNMPRLQTIDFRLNGKKTSLDHVNFMSVKRSDYKKYVK
ncbi:hypothetical protein [Kurthia huakuii]|uniref:hypothetical protein n=1 Tax=Kurthia huakuii TaxID=1421019 RepID=UPI000495DCE8|nr:hypothetical protein [Kurthia huakuii]MBM7699104.1 hypothetical protein [Kurthia huakuii]